MALVTLRLRYARRGQHTTGPQHAPHLDQRAYRVAQVLQELMRVHVP